MTGARLGDVIDGARQQGFVGRRAELAGFDAALAGSSPRRVLLVHGPGGIGKSMLLLQMRARARAAGRTVILLDGLDLDPSPEGLTGAFRSGTVLLLDGYESMSALDGWMRTEFVPSRPADHVLVLAGRDPPAPAWRADPGLRHVVAVHRLDHLDDAESGDLLARAGVPEPVRPRLRDLGRGHPLALALLADAALGGDVPDQLADVPDLVSALLESLVADAPTDAHQIGLATCAKAWVTTEDLLRATVGDDAPAVWAWLRRRPFVVCRPQGLSPHDLTREVLEAEFERRSPARYRSLHRAVHDHVVAGIGAATGPDRQALAQHLLYLHRHSPFTDVLHALRSQGSVAVLPARPAEIPHLVSMVEDQLGSPGAALAERWFADQPEQAHVIRTDDGIAAFVQYLFCPTGSALEEQDPVVREILEHVEQTAPVRPGERTGISRFLVTDRGGQTGPYAVLTGTISSLVQWCTEPLAWSFLIFSDDEFWRPHMDYIGFRRRLRTSDGSVVYGHDWRRFPIGDWLDFMAERENDGGTGPVPESRLRPPPLSRDAFGAAVRAALAQLNRPGAARPDIDRAIAHLSREPKGDRLAAVLHCTYVRPAPTQEAAAEALGLPFSTYRRHLARAVDELTEILWAAEIGTMSSD